MPVNCPETICNQIFANMIDFAVLSVIIDFIIRSAYGY